MTINRHHRLAALACTVAMTAFVLAAPDAAAEDPPAEEAQTEPSKTEPGKPETAEPAKDAAAEPKPEPAPGEDPAATPVAKPTPKARPTVAMPDLGGTSGDQDIYGLSDDLVPPGSRLDWAKRRDIKVVQKRAVVKEGRHGLSLLIGAVPNDDFWTYITAGLGYNYYFSEDLALNIHGVYTAEQATSLRNKLQGQRPEGFELQVRLPQTLTAYASAGADWNLLHGKIGFFGTQLGEFDVALCFGVGAVVTTVTTQAYPLGKQRIDAAGNVGASAQFYLSEHFALRADYHQLFYPGFNDQKNDASGGLAHPLAVFIGLTYFTAPPQ